MPTSQSLTLLNVWGGWLRETQHALHGLPFDSRFERLRLDFNSSIEKLRTAMLAVIGSANEVNETTGEIGGDKRACPAH